jgi:ABC-2 type transport system ATP-binding protein
VTTHAIEEAEVCDAVCIVDQGRIIAHGTPADLKAQHGTRLFRAKPADEDAAAAILGAFGARAQRSGQDIVIETAGEERFDTMLQQYGARIRQLTVEEPSLESVFLTLTGREIRDGAASARERTFEFGKRGGEHTR